MTSLEADRVRDADEQRASDLVAGAIQLGRLTGVPDDSLARHLLAGAVELAKRSITAQDWAESLRIMAVNVAPHSAPDTRN